MSVNQISALERTMYNDEFREDFEREESLLKKCVRSDGLMKAGTVTWDVLSPSDVAEERTRDGNIPESSLGLSQVTGTPKEQFKKYRIDSFDAYKSNPNVRSAQNKKGITSCNQAIDQSIIDALDTSTNTAGTLSLNSFGAVLDWTTTLWENDVKPDGKVWGLLTPRAAAQLMRINEYKSSDFVTVRPAEKGLPAVGYRHWLDVNWLMHTGLTGKGTSTAKVHLFHESAIGHQIAGEPETHAYYYEPQDRWEAWAKVCHVAKMCLQRGSITAVHDDTAALV